ncbi:MBL fold metallo-hydrolase [Sphingomonas sp.]|uniref:MBL fold metallo-hydrolase n=1 Tax=Sphingomonas sp. TaxID=28214 RepID=UPI0031E2904F
MHRPFIDQIKQLGIAPEKITLITLSHTHFDHSGQAADFPNATLIPGRRDLAGLTANPTPPNVAPDMLAHWVKEGGRIDVVDGNRDVVGDGGVRMVLTLGHTAGHHSLLVTLRGNGPALLTGYVWNFKEQMPIHGDRLCHRSRRRNRFGRQAGPACPASLRVGRDPARTRRRGETAAIPGLGPVVPVTWTGNDALHSEGQDNAERRTSGF